MKLAIVTATFPPYLGGTGNVAYHHARLMHERGHQVSVFTADYGKETVPSFPFPVHYLKSWWRMGNAPFTPGLVKPLGKFDVIHLHYPYIFGAELTRWAAHRNHIPLVVTYHNRLEESSPVKRFLFGVYNRLLEQSNCLGADALVAVSRDHLNSLHPEWSDHRRVAEVSNGVDMERFNVYERVLARRRLNMNIDGKVVLFVGALDKAHRFKGVPVLLRAMTCIPDKVVLIVVGDGDLRQELELEAKRLNVASRVTFAGAKLHSELAWYYNAADVTVLPSTGVESFGLVLIESMACGTPVIASDLPGVRKVMPKTPGQEWLVPVGDSQALARAIEVRISKSTSGEEREIMRTAVGTQFSWQMIGEQLEAVYGGVLA